MKEIAIIVENATKTYKNVRAVNNLSFSVKSGECYGLLGPNGAGKTTMMKMLYGKTLMDSDCRCSINVFGYNPKENELEIKYLSGIVQQEDNLDLELSVIQNLLIYSRFYGLPKKVSLPRIEYLLDFMDLSEKKDSRIRQLSGGMKRRLSIARSLINSPKLLILDEPTTGLDPQVRHIIWDRVRALQKEGVTVLLTTHYMEEAFQLCDRLSIMNNGEKILEGKPIKLIESNIEPYVLEVFNLESMRGVKYSNKIRSENTDSRALLYSENLNALNRLSKNMETGEFYLRQSNLEDLFLKVTGRNLND
jgi:lipooligosaccharide transport system ATP-binding protein